MDPHPARMNTDSTIAGSDLKNFIKLDFYGYD